MRRLLAFALRGLAALAAIAAAIYVVALVWAGAALRNAREELTAQGRPMRLEEIIPAEIPDWENAAPLYESAWRLLQATREGEESLWNALSDLARKIADDTATPEDRARFTLLVARPEAVAALDLVRRAAERSACRFEVRWDMGAAMLLPHVGPIRNLAGILSAEGRHAAEAGDGAAAWAAAATALRLAEALRDEPILISQLARIAMANSALDLIRDLAIVAPPDDRTAEELDALLRALDDRAPFVAVLDGERLLLGEWSFNQDPRAMAAMDMSRSSWDRLGYSEPIRRFDHAAYLRLMGRHTRAAAVPYRYARTGAEDTEPPRYAILTRMLLPPLTAIRRKSEEFLARVRVTRAALALERRRAARGAYPATLADLAPDLSAEAIADPFVDGSLTYRRTDDGFTLYSVGPDGKDNNGAPKRNTSQAEWDIPWVAPGARSR